MELNVNEVLESIKPLNLGRRIVFQRYCQYLIKEGKIVESNVEEFLSPKFLFEDEDEELITVNNEKLRYFFYFTFDALSVYLAYKLIKLSFF